SESATRSGAVEGQDGQGPTTICRRFLISCGGMIAKRQATDVTEDDVALANDPASLRKDFLKKLFFELAKFPGVATTNDYYLALAYVVRDRLLLRWVRSARTYLEGQHRTVIYLSAEYLLGPQLENNLLCLGMEGPIRETLAAMGLSLDELI